MKSFMILGKKVVMDEDIDPANARDGLAAAEYEIARIAHYTDNKYDVYRAFYNGHGWTGWAVWPEVSDREDWV